MWLSLAHSLRDVGTEAEAPQTEDQLVLDLEADLTPQQNRDNPTTTVTKQKR